MSFRLLYLHGFASSPSSAKGVALQRRLQSRGFDLSIPDLNQGDFTHLTLTRQIQQVADWVQESPDSPAIVIGSSLGGLVAAWGAETLPQIQRLLLLAPAFHFLDHWVERLGIEQIQRWQQQQVMSVFHYGENRYLPLDYGFLRDVEQYADQDLMRPVPTLIFHGRADQVIPIESSREYARSRSWVELVELESDHALGNVLDRIGSAVESWL